MNAPAKKVPQDHLRSRKRPAVVRAYIASDSEIAAERAELEKEVTACKIQAEAFKNDRNLRALEEAQDRLDAHRKEHPEIAIEFRFKAMNRKAFVELAKAHAPTEEQIAEFEKESEKGELEWNPETFPQALIARCMIQDEMDEDELIEWLNSDAWNQTELLELFAAAYSANLGRQVVDMGKGSARGLSLSSS
jgi:hypothetical protein